MRTLFAAVLAVLIAGCVARKSDYRPVAVLSSAELIDRLVHVDQAAFDARPDVIEAIKYWDDRTVALQAQQRSRAKADDAMWELVRRGMDSMPALLAHLDDRRQTNVVITGWRVVYAARYDWNPRTAATKPVGVTTDWAKDDTLVINGGLLSEDNNHTEKEDDTNKYHVTVCDICFNLIGEIVNRDFRTVGYHYGGPGADICSPKWAPAVAAALRKEWGGLTSDTHRALLVADVSHPDNINRDISAAWVLEKFYPDALPTAVAERLALPEYDERAIGDFLHDMSYCHDTESAKLEAREFYNAASPANREGLLSELPEANGDWHTDPAALFHELRPDLDRAGPLPFRAVSHPHTFYFLKSIELIHSPEIDNTVWACFVKHSGSHADVLDPSDLIVAACVDRLGKRGSHDAEFVAYFRRRIKELRIEEERQQLQERIDTLAKK